MRSAAPSRSARAPGPGPRRRRHERRRDRAWSSDRARPARPPVRTADSPPPPRSPWRSPSAGRLRADEHGDRVLFAEVGPQRPRGPTILAGEGARALETALRAAGLDAAARGRLAWLRLADDSNWIEHLRCGLDAARPIRAAIVHLPPERWREGLDSADRLTAALLRADLPAQRALAALVSVELLELGLRVRIASHPPGRVACAASAGRDRGRRLQLRARRAPRAGAGGAEAPAHAPADRSPLCARDWSPRADRPCRWRWAALWRSSSAPCLLAAFGGAVTGKSRVQRAADLAALSAARSMRDDFERLFAPERLPTGSAEPGPSLEARLPGTGGRGGGRGGAAKRRRSGAARDRVPRRSVVRAASGRGRDLRRGRPAGTDPEAGGRGRGDGGGRPALPRIQRPPASLRTRPVAATRGRSPTGRASRCAPTSPRRSIV